MRQRLGTERGTSTLEFIVVLPFLLFIFLVGLELSRAWLTAHIASSAVREGARLGAVTPAANVECSPTSSGVACTRITDILGSIPIKSGYPTVTCENVSGSGCQRDSETTTASRVTATVKVQFQTVVPLFLTMLEPNNCPLPGDPTRKCLEITQTATMRYE